ncbi:hypothetical protein CDL12_25338 [Handroanthus impetiginosus]|uniref:ARM repeat N-terminal plant domain-containing protein n=1 Tax=Handroanthus impetiginosus TaxID=429701 RepID=A0A2G9GA99_9LAMI|nr:hypothetical protein CDL12_25338 [Handroanthus impetiginosus]
MPLEQLCPRNSCFFCIMKEPASSIRRATMKDYLKGIGFLDDEELILVVSSLWTVAMTQPDDEELPSLGIFECMASLINKAINDTTWLLKHQNIYIPYYAAHIIGSYTMNKVDFAVKAVESGVIPPLLELLRGKMSWVEQRVAIRALGHLASYEKTFMSLRVYEDEVVKLAMKLASSCLEEVYTMFVGNRKAEEWASQLQCWSVHLLNCFAIKERSLGLICNKEFLKDLSDMWGGLVNHTSAGGLGLIRILCYSKVGRESISKSRQVIENLCNVSRSSDDWQYMAIDCLLLLLKDQDTRYKVIDIATMYLVDLIELRSLANRTNLGETITRALVHDYKHRQSRIQNVDIQTKLAEIWDLKVVRRKTEQNMSTNKLEAKMAMAKLIKQQGNHGLSFGEIEEAILKYSEALQICPLKYRNERVMLYSSRAKCNLLLRDPNAAISDATRALCLSNPTNSNANSLWIRAQAYDMIGMAKESLMDCIMFINSYTESNTDNRVRFPYYAIRMITKQMESTWLFGDAHLKAKELSENGEMIRFQVKNKRCLSGLSTILEESFDARERRESVKGRNQTI